MIFQYPNTSYLYLLYIRYSGIEFKYNLVIFNYQILNLNKLTRTPIVEYG